MICVNQVLKIAQINILGGWDVYMRCPPRTWLKIDRNVKYFLRISGDFITNLMQINSSLQTKSVLNSVTVSHIHHERLDALGITPLLRDFALRSELHRCIFGKFE
jgi:hypothetical protein